MARSTGRLTTGLGGGPGGSVGSPRGLDVVAFGCAVAFGEALGEARVTMMTGGRWSRTSTGTVSAAP
jgi:hypothetical protein